MAEFSAIRSLSNEKIRLNGMVKIIARNILCSPKFGSCCTRGLYEIESTVVVMVATQVLPQAICSRHGLAISANLVWLVKVLMFFCLPISYSVGKVSYILGRN